MALIKRFEDLEIWQLARTLSKNTIELIMNNDALSKDFSLKDQIKRSAGSVMDNIAEGFGRGGNNEFVYFLSIANGSVQEYKSQLYRVYDSKYIDDDKFNHLYNSADVIGKKTAAFIQYLKSSSYKGEKFKKGDNTSNLSEPFLTYEIQQKIVN